MQSVVLYGRFLARAVLTGINNDFQTPSLTSGPSNHKTLSQGLHLVTCLSGFSKNQSTAQVLPKWTFGDDACFVAGHKLGSVIGVADGVGGWRAYGVDPSMFSRSLMETCERMVKEGLFQPSEPGKILADSYYELMESKNPLIGSCTACIISLYNKDNSLYTANLGDSGFLVIRKGKVVHRSEEQQHYFNTPFQLSVAPSTLQGVVLSDSPESAEATTFGVREGDIILVGSDGLFDNLSDEMILHHVAKLKGSRKENLQKIANSLAQHAHELAFDPDYMSPFATNACQNGINVQGGKPDDITVVLARVSTYPEDTDISNPYT